MFYIVKTYNIVKAVRLLIIISWIVLENMQEKCRRMSEKLEN